MHHLRHPSKVRAQAKCDSHIHSQKIHKYEKIELSSASSSSMAPALNDGMIELGRKSGFVGGCGGVGVQPSVARAEAEIEQTEKKVVEFYFLGKSIPEKKTIRAARTIFPAVVHRQWMQFHIEFLCVYLCELEEGKSELLFIRKINFLMDWLDFSSIMCVPFWKSKRYELLRLCEFSSQFLSWFMNFSLPTVDEHQSG